MFKNLSKVLVLLVIFTHLTGRAGEVDQVVNHFLLKNPVGKLKWDWGESVFLYGLSKYPKYDYIQQKFTERWLNKGPPKIDRSDRCPAALAAVHLVKKGSFPEGKVLAELVENYIKSGPLNELETLDHLGHSWFSYFYPSSIWVDSLMMYAVFSGEWGKYKGDSDLVTFALSQPLRFAGVLQDPSSGLFWHAYLFGQHKTIPSDQSFWLRGNGWVLTAVIELIDLFKDYRENKILVDKNKDLFKRLAASVAKFQKQNGAFDTILNRPGYSYDETSGTLLVAYAFAKAHRLGLLPDEYQTRAQAAFRFGQGQLSKSKQGLSLGGISGPTNPGSAFMYKLVRKRSDLSYGVGAYLLAASELIGH